MSQTFSFSILKEDWTNSSQRFGDIYNCPFATAFKRQYPQYETVGVGPFNVIDPSGQIAYIEDMFSPDRCEELSQGKEFHTQITFL